MSYLRLRPELLKKFRAGERAALEEVYRAYLPRIAGMLRRGFIVAGDRKIPGCANPDDLADALQEVFARAFARDARLAYDGRRDYGPYLGTIARNVVVSRHRKQSRELLVVDVACLVDSEVAAADDGDVQWLDARSLEIARAYVSSLEEPIRAVHRARYVDSLSQRDAATQLGLSRSKLRKLEDRLRRGLRALLTQAGLYREDKSESSAAGQGLAKLWTNKPRTN